jgi:hypothetical protein
MMFYEIVTGTYTLWYRQELVAGLWGTHWATTLIPLRIHGFSQSGSERWDNLVSIFSEQFPFFYRTRTDWLICWKIEWGCNAWQLSPNPSKSNCLNPCPVRKNIAILGIDSDRSHLWINFPPDRKPCSSACWFDDLKTWKKLRRHRCNDPRDLCSVANYNVRSTRNVYMPPTPPHPKNVRFTSTVFGPQA